MIKEGRFQDSTTLFLDSGSYTLMVRAKEHAIKYRCEQAEYYDTREFWEYLSRYISFLKKRGKLIEHYANLDVIGNPELTYRNQKYLEKQELDPVPVVHQGANMDWVKRYCKTHDYIAFGGMVGGSNRDFAKWLDNVFPYTKGVKVHGFGITSYKMLIRYPWYSVDSASWARAAAYSNLFVPHKRRGRFVFSQADLPISVKWNSTRDNPYMFTFSDRTNTKREGFHFERLPYASQQTIREWYEQIGIPIGNSEEKGLCNHYGTRAIANAIFFTRIAESMSQVSLLKLFLSGGGTPWTPENFIPNNCVMLSFFTDYKDDRISTRLKRILKARKEKLCNKQNTGS